MKKITVDDLTGKNGGFEEFAKLKAEFISAIEQETRIRINLFNLRKRLDIKTMNDELAMLA